MNAIMVYSKEQGEVLKLIPQGDEQVVTLADGRTGICTSNGGLDTDSRWIALVLSTRKIPATVAKEGSQSNARITL